MQNGLFQKDKVNLLPTLGKAYYTAQFLTQQTSLAYFSLLKSQILWEQEQITIAGKTLVLTRMVAWYGDQPFSYTYSGSTKIAHIWTKELQHLKHLVETACQEKYNACLLNFYPDGESGMGWHSDNENSIEPDSSIASLSIGAARKFSFKQKSGNKTLSLVLENGSLLEMRGTTQSHWLHSLPKSKKIREPRINLTFRKMRSGHV